MTESKIVSENYSPASVNLPAGAVTATLCGNDLAPLLPAAQFYRQLLSDKSVDRLLNLSAEMKAAFIGENLASFPSVRSEALHSEKKNGDCLAVRTIGSLAVCDRWLLVVDGSMPPLVDPLLNKFRQLLATQEEVAVILLSLAQKQQFQSKVVIESLMRIRPTDQETLITKANGLSALLGKTFANELLAVVQGLAACKRDAAEIIFPQLWDSFRQAAGFDPSRDLQKLTAVIATDLFVPGDDVPNKWPSLFDWVNRFEPLPATRIVLTNVGQQSYQDANCANFLAAGGRIAPARQPMIERLVNDLVTGKKVSRLLGKTYSRYTKLVEDYWDS